MKIGDALKAICLEAEAMYAERTRAASEVAE